MLLIYIQNNNARQQKKQFNFVHQLVYFMLFRYSKQHYVAKTYT